MMKSGTKCGVSVALVFLAVGCGNGAGERADGGGIDAPRTATHDGHSDSDLLLFIAPRMDANTIPAAGDAGACPISRYDSPGFVCFGADPGPYRHYLLTDAGVEVGQCPQLTDFPVESVGDGSCANLPCGPLLPSAISHEVDGGAKDAGASLCCFWIRFICGV
jgi:hypothetical protein